MTTGPAFSVAALSWTSLNLRAASWVRNGKPSMLTVGLLLSPPWVCTWLANLLSA